MKIIRVLSRIVLFVAFLNIFAFSVRHVVTNGEKLGVLTAPFKYFIEIPLQIKSVVGEFTKLPPYHVQVDDVLEEINILDKDVYSLNAHFDKDRYVYVLNNLRTDSILHRWWFTKDQFNASFEPFNIAHPQNPILLEDGSMVGILSRSKNLFRLDKSSKIMWQDTSKVFHHSLNMSHDNHIWACGYEQAYTKNECANNTVFRDDILMKIDVQTGTVVFEKSLAEILISNGQTGLVHGCINDENPEGEDLFHLNDIQPILTDGEFWKKGDVLLSVRNRSLIILYRPVTNKILRIITGPFIAQHDVDVISDNEISIFNNNRVGINRIASSHETNTFKATNLTIKSSNIVVYNFSDSTFRKPYLDMCEKEEIYTIRQGTHTFLENGDLFIESTETGKIYIFRDNKVMLRKYANKKNSQGTAEYPHWMRIYENVNF